MESKGGGALTRQNGEERKSVSGRGKNPLAVGKWLIWKQQGVHSSLSRVIEAEGGGR